ncbi:hypothetical protein HPB50_001595 [Hyalomma asiaticum]|uniref:Uncharacterized protein n=1 Tax=Hyalomma asiaticum TaxID=266040 RepID=A0ACB7TD59_HYAAI|nr:hypothetical protein HPB50_001595 [Hyalomma asiaticum]
MRRGSPRVFAVGDRVLVRPVHGLVYWWPGEVMCVKSSSTYRVYVRNTERMVDVDHVRPSNIEPTARHDRVPTLPEVELPRASDSTYYSDDQPKSGAVGTSSEPATSRQSR